MDRAGVQPRLPIGSLTSPQTFYKGRLQKALPSPAQSTAPAGLRQTNSRRQKFSRNDPQLRERGTVPEERLELSGIRNPHCLRIPGCGTFGASSIRQPRARLPSSAQLCALAHSEPVQRLSFCFLLAGPLRAILPSTPSHTLQSAFSTQSCRTLSSPLPALCGDLLPHLFSSSGSL